MNIWAIIIVILVLCAGLYLLAGDLGLLPDSFYEACDESNPLEERIKNGCEGESWVTKIFQKGNNIMEDRNESRND